MDRDYLIEYKRTDKKSITIKLEDLETLRTNALLEGRQPLLGFEIGGRDWVAVEADEFERIRSGCARTGLDAGEVPAARPRTVLPTDGQGAQEAAPRSQGRVQRKQSTGSSRVSRARGVS